jgi:hypothetical protein
LTRKDGASDNSSISVAVIAPPQTREPSHDEVEALIEEARRRTRRRRLVIAAAAAGAVAIGDGVAALIVLAVGGGSATSGVPAGFHLVQARGPVAHATIVEYPPIPQTVVDEATGRERGAPLVLEVWWDQRSGFERVVGGIEGRVEFQTVGQMCQGAPDSPRRFASRRRRSSYRTCTIAGRSTARPSAWSGEACSGDIM